MKIGIAAPLSIALVNGGVKTQVLQTTKHLKNIGLDVEFIHLDQTHFDYDLVHVFAAGPETVGISKQVADSGIKLVVSPVFYSNRSTSTISASLKVEKTVSGIGSGIRSDFGIKSEICNWADLVLPNTRSELELVRDGLKVPPSKLHMIPNGVESRFAESTPLLFQKTYGVKDFVLFVGQAGAPRKNVIQLLKAASNLDEQIVIIGSFYENDYSRQCLEIVNSLTNVLLIENMEHDSPLLESAYAACKVFCLPSLYETPGIAAMEAALAGANISITRKGGTTEYFRELAHYFDPNNQDQLESSIRNALLTENSSELRDHILSNFTWEIVAKKTARAYSIIS